MAPPSCTTIGAAVEAAGCGGAIIDQAAGQVLYLGIGRHRGHGLAIDLVKTAEATLSRSGAHDLQNRATGRRLTQLTQRLEADSRGEEPPAKCHRFVCKQTGCCTLRSACGASCAGAPRGVLSSTAEEEWNLEDRLKDFDNLDGATGSDSQWPCPVCGTVFVVVPRSLWQCVSRGTFAAATHGVDRSLVLPSRKLDVVEASSSIPATQRVWTCPVKGCNKGGSTTL